MAIELKQAFEAWKKAKPVTLHETGISGALRALSRDPSIVTDFNKDLSILENCLRAINAGVGDKRIAAVKPAHECLKQIQAALLAQINKHKVLRGQLSAAMKKVLDGGRAMMKTPTKTIADRIKSDTAAFNKLCDDFRPAKAELIQVPMRVEMMARVWVIELGKPGPKLEGIKNEMTAFMKKYPNLAF